MLTVNAITKSYGIETILDQVSFTVNSGERLGLVGPNGCGKTTLLRILSGQEKADKGNFQLSPPDLRVGYLSQGLDSQPDQTIASWLDEIAGDFVSLSRELEALAADLAENPGDPSIQQSYDSKLTAVQAASINQEQSQSIMAALDLDQISSSTLIDHLSGGQKTRLALAGVLVSSPELLMLDEPTNHLDIKMLSWLEDWLMHSPLVRRSAALIVSHDRVFLNRTVTGILEIDPNTQKIRTFPGNYTDYLEQKLAEMDRNWKAYTDQQEEIRRLRRAAEIVRGQAAYTRGGKGDSGDKFAKGFFADQSRRQVKRAKHIERRIEKIYSEELIEKPHQSWQIKLDFEPAAENSRQVLVLENLDIGYDSQPLLINLNLSLRYGNRLALIGPNGSGKTTLLRTIAGLLPPLAGRVRLGRSVKLGYMAQEQETLDPLKNALEIISNLASVSETDQRAFLHKFLFSGDDVFIPSGKLSFGERARLMLACLVLSGSNLLLLDEPINHLDIPSRTRFEQALTGFPGTVIAVVHDRYFISGFATRIWEVIGDTLLEKDPD